MSVVVPVYNTEKYIANCLDSLLNQDIGKNEYEIICINDGSTDNSLAILQEYAEKHENIVLIDKPNGGVAAARNLGMEKARGEYIWFVDADDWVARNCLGIIKTQATDHSPSLVHIHFDWIRAEWRVKECAEIALNKENVNCVTAEDIYQREIIGVWSFIIKRDILLRNHHRFIENLHYGEDVMFVRDLFDIMRLETASNEARHPVIHCQNEIFYYYRQHDESAMHISWTKNRDKYMDALLKMARLDRKRMLDASKPKWYIEQYSVLFYDRMYNYMMHWLPSVEGDWKDYKYHLKDEELYPCIKPSVEIRKKMLKADGIVAKVKAAYKYCAFRFVWLYPLYYRQMQRKYIQHAVQDDVK